MGNTIIRDILSIKRNTSLAGLVTIFIFLGSLFTTAKCQEPEAPHPIYKNDNGELVYRKDEWGNRIPDFSYSGYMAGEQPIPDVPIKMVVPVKSGDDTRRIQAALDYVATLPVNEQGIRGAVLLEKGTYKVSGHLTFDDSGVILRGSGMSEDGTILIGTGTTRETLIRIAGTNNRNFEQKRDIADPYVPVNAMQFKVENPGAFEMGDRVQIRRPSTRKWIEKLDMVEFAGNINYLGWKPGERDIVWDRTITGIDDHTIAIDAPLTTALDSTYGGGTVAAYSWPGRIRQVGIENIRLVSEYDHSNPKDEAHRWMAISMENVEDAWVRQVVFEHFAGSAVDILRTGRRITVEDSKSLEPVSEIGGQRRYTFWTKGQQTLFQRLYAEHGYHDFAAGNLATLNAFVQCTSHQPYSFSGAINSWTSGTLFDIINVHGEAIRFANRGREEQGAGWTAANSMIWQASAAKIEIDTPPTAQNWAIGVWSQYYGDNTYWGHVNDHVNPRSLYYAQLAQRVGPQVQERANLLPISTTSYTSPTKKEAAEQIAEAYEPGLQLDNWIDKAPERNPIPTAAPQARRLQPSDVSVPRELPPAPPVTVVNGKVVQGGRLLIGKRQTVQWWRGESRPYYAEKARPHVTRFMPGDYSYGFTDSLQHVVNYLDEHHVATLDHNYALWYDRRRMDHQRVHRMDPNVWGPFLELPFARSGEGIGWDGLSKYDLTEYNTWYWSRLKKFASLAEREGIVLINQNYFQHNILEAGAHWVDFPWRTANNINSTDFPEPPHFAGDKRIFMSKQFYDTTNAARRPLHKAFIRKNMSSFVDNSNVLQFIGAEYTGPLHFVEFWIDTIQDWSDDTGKDPFIGLSVTKDVQDAILADKDRSSTVDLIDIRRWFYREDGSLYAPKGGEFLAPRQHARLVEPGSSSFEQVYHAVHEYRQKYPGKAVMYSSDGEAHYGWAVFMAGGSFPRIPEVEDPEFLEDAASMHPVESRNTGQWILGNEQNEYIIYSRTSDSVQLDLGEKAVTMEISWISPEDGHIEKQEKRTVGDGTLELTGLPETSAVIWVNNQ